jgi:hypothetical protein
MRNDIFIDTNIASRFANPRDPEYIKLYDWLRANDEKNPNKSAFLVVSKKLLVEYMRSNRDYDGQQNIVAIVALLREQNRLTEITNTQIKDFQQKHFTKAVEKKLKCNHEDREHIPVVLLSDRKFALAIDKNFCADLQSFPRHSVTVHSRPENLPYGEDWSSK